MKITLYMSQTMNGMIAKENGECPWSEAVWNSYYIIAKQFKAIILGRTTYNIMKEVEEFPKIGNPFTIVLTRKKMKNEKNTLFVSSPKDAIAVLKEQGFKEVLLGGGGKTNASFLKAGLVDEIILDVEPLMFGKGLPFVEAQTFDVALQLLDVKKLSENTIQVRYAVKK